MVGTKDAKPGLLRRGSEFRKLWAAGAISQFGTYVSNLAIPLFSLYDLHAGVLQVTLLTTMRTGAALLVGLPAGGLVDRLRCRPVMIAADLGRMVLFGSIPVAALLHVASIGQLYAVVFLGGVLSIFFDVASQTHLPVLVGHEDLVEGNARLQINTSVAATVGPSVAGLLVQWFTAPFAVAIDALSYLGSAIGIRAIRTPEPPRPSTSDRLPLRVEIGAGLRFVFGHKVLRPIGCYLFTEAFFQGAGFTGLLTLFLVGPLRLTPGLIGLLGGFSMLGAVAGSLLATRVARRLGRARALFVSGLAIGVGALLVPLAQPGWLVVCYVVGNAILGFSIILNIVTETAIGQAACPEELRGRMSATMHIMSYGGLPLGSLVGGFIGTAIGVRPTIWAAAVGMLLSAIWLLFAIRASPAQGRQ
ncbi:MAG TPA: MFS transporter [Pseudonocardiaceae bacterium]|jgi:MFS family permease|nr:MFS transporter [Pseudonocardiaceae bacterium]